MFGFVLSCCVVLWLGLLCCVVLCGCIVLCFVRVCDCVFGCSAVLFYCGVFFVLVCVYVSEACCCVLFSLV